MEDNLFKYSEIALLVISIILGVTSLIGGFVTGMWHCFLIGAMCIALPYVWYVEEYESKGKSLWQKKNTKN